MADVELGILKNQMIGELFLASPGPDYKRIWIRDNCQIIYSLFTAGFYNQAKSSMSELLKLVKMYNHKFFWIVNDGKPAREDNWKLLHPVYYPSRMELEEEWGWNQNDAWGLLLFCAGEIEEKFPGFLTISDKEILQKIVFYLMIIRYWEEDNGIWEENSMVNAVSIVTCLKGLEKISPYVMVPEDMMAAGERTFRIMTIGNNFCYSQTRKMDLSLLQLIYPLRYVLNKDLLENVEQALLREKGLIRYFGDSYESSDHEPKEAQWPLGLFWLGLAWATLGDKEKAHDWWVRANATRTIDDYIPESYALKETENGLAYEPCPHTPLTWAHAFAIALRSFISD